MNIKKHLQQMAENDTECWLTESDIEYCKQLAQTTQVKFAKPEGRFKIQKYAGILGGCAVAVALVITLPLVLNRTPVEDVLYKDDNILEQVCLIQDLNANTKYFELYEHESMSYRTILKYDSISEDKLYYSVQVTSAISEFTLYVVVNSNYNLKFELNDNLSTVTLSDYEVNFSSDITGGLMTVNNRYKGYIEVNTEKVYIDYTQVIDLGELSEQAFFDDIQSVLKLKN